jgi:hypothetical protein
MSNLSIGENNSTNESHYELAVLLGRFAICLHLFLSNVQFGILLYILKSKSDENSKRNNLKDPQLNSFGRPRILNIQDMTQRKQWFNSYLFVFLSLLFYIINDSYFLTLPNFLFQPSRGVILMYIVSFVIRSIDKLLTVPNLTDVVLDYYYKRSKSDTFDALTIGTGFKLVRYGFFFALSSIPPTATVFINSFLFFASLACDNYFVCIFSWDHWYQMTNTMGALFFFFRHHFSSEFRHHWFIAAFLILISITQFLIPFLFFHDLLAITLVLSLYYGFGMICMSLYLLHIYYAPDEE